MFNAIIKNYKTTLAGLAACITAISHIVANGGSITTADVSAFFVGVGLILGKDFNVTGGDNHQ